MYTPRSLSMGSATSVCNLSLRRLTAHPPCGSTSSPPLVDDNADPMHMTFDELEMQRSCHFIQALKELKNLRPQLYSAAEYCESSYFHSNQKQMILDNLKEYSVKALVNAVDHLGTVAFKLNELLGQRTTEISATELRAASVAQRMRSCQEHSDREGLKQQSLAKSLHTNHKHYVMPGPHMGDFNPSLLRETFDSVNYCQSSLKADLFHHPTSRPQAQVLENFSALADARYIDVSTPRKVDIGYLGHSTSNLSASIELSTQRSGSFTPFELAPLTWDTGIVRSSTLDPPVHAEENYSAKYSRSAQAQSKSLLRSLLGRKSPKPRASKPA